LFTETLILAQGNILSGCPYENPAIISVIKHELFYLVHLMRCYPPKAKKAREVTPSLLTFAATAVR
jgi:hypothetical protein